jgi:hypothetical protein
VWVIHEHVGRTAIGGGMQVAELVKVPVPLGSGEDGVLQLGPKRFSYGH